MENDFQNQITALKSDIEDLRYMLHKKIGGGSADVRANIVAPSSLASSVSIPAGTITKTQVSYEVVSVTITAGNPSGTGTITSGSIVLGYYSTSNQDQFVDNVSISGTTLTITLAGNATANNTFSVVLLKA